MLRPNRVLSRFSSPYPNALPHVQNEDLTVADIARTGTLDNRVEGRLDELVIDGYFQSDLLQQIHFDIHATIAFMVAALLATPEGVSHRQLEDLAAVERLFNSPQFLRLNVGNDQFHNGLAPLTGVRIADPGV
jgi:hypothetical protein